ncbi:LPP20 family lipoprotein [Balneolaceae bacterium ANBcel3]|nr:LPP20 family lipoprotein [Balneolaceae bacterium ANBcel3]
MRHSKFNSIFLLASIVIIASACSSTSAIEDAEPNLPDWYLSPPADNSEYLYTIGEAESQRRGTASDQARVSAQGAMAAKLETMVEGMQKLFEEEITSGEESNYREAWTNVTRTITQQELRGGSVAQRDFVVNHDTGRYEAFILYQLPVGDARSQLENSLSMEEELYTRFRESEAFEEMNQRLEQLSGDN